MVVINSRIIEVRYLSKIFQKFFAGRYMFKISLIKENDENKNKIAQNKMALNEY